MVQKEEFTRFEIARILGARALQVSMDAPLLIKISKEELEEINYDSLKIAEKEFNSDVLPISIKRPLPAFRGTKLESIKEEKIDDEKIIAKEKEIEAEITKKAVEEGFVEEDDQDDTGENVSSSEEN